jgi:hypothetical protein
MRNLILVAFVEPVADGLEFPRDDWPLHITLVKFDVDGGPGTGLPDRIAGLIDQPVRSALGQRLSIGADAGFGRMQSIPVSLVEPSRPLQSLHETLVRTVVDLPGKVPTPNYTMENYRPHVSHHGDKRMRPGDDVVLDRVALVDMAPDGDHTVRRILMLWEVTK